MSAATSANCRSRKRTDTTVPPGYRRIDLAAPPNLGGLRNAGTARPAARAAAVRRRAASAKRNVGDGSFPTPTTASMTAGCDSHPGRTGYTGRVTVLVGTSGWQYRDWRGAFYPQGLAQA